jgi:predicted PurR-regulated permease PerM
MNPVRTVPDLLASLWRQPWLRLLAAGALWFARPLLSVLVTAAIAYALAYLVNPGLTWLERRGIRRAFGVLLVVVAGLLLAGLLGWVVIAQLVNLLGDLPTLLPRLGTLTGALFDRLSGVPGLDHLQERLSAWLTGQASSLGQNLGPTLQRLLSSGGSLLGGVVGLVGWLGQVVFVLLLSVYFMLGYVRIGASLLLYLPRPWRTTAQLLASDVSASFGGYIRGQLLIGLGVGLLVALGLSILGIPNALAIGLLAAVLDIVPYLGPLISAVPALLLALPQGALAMLLVAVVFVAANQIEGSLLSPYILGRTTRLSPAVVLLAILSGLTLGGLLGALLAIPTVTLLHRWTERYWLSSEVHDPPEHGDPEPH